MSDNSTFEVPDSDQVTGRYIVTFEEGQSTAAIAELNKACGVSKKLPSADDFEESALDISEIEPSGGAVFPEIGVAVVTLDQEGAESASGLAGGGGAILGVEPERMFYATTPEVVDAETLGGATLKYLTGYRDGVDAMLERALTNEEEQATLDNAAVTSDDALSTWGIRATGVLGSPHAGHGIKIAVLDTGMDLQNVHPDFVGRTFRTRSFISGESVQDNNGHGTHCIGTAAGRVDVSGRRYGVAHRAQIFVGKVLSNGGSGPTSAILAGMEWAISNGCQVISMSLGNRVPTPSMAYETVGQRALDRGCLIIAAAGNHKQRGNFGAPPPGTVGQPANAPSIMAVAAVDSRLVPATFSAQSGASNGANVDISGPGVSVYSSVPDPFPPSIQPTGAGRPWPPRYHTISGTSMATPHVAGIAALYAEAFGARGARLWQMLVSRAMRLPHPTVDVGAGLVQAPR
ncbi:MAG: S8 family serine peptidase [Planctomycetota bacterium]